MTTFVLVLNVVALAALVGGYFLLRWIARKHRENYRQCLNDIVRILEDAGWGKP